MKYHGLNRYFSISKQIIEALCLSMLMTLVAISVSSADYNAQTVSEYAVVSAVETGSGEITVTAQANYCTSCNPNPLGKPGCTPFENGAPPYGFQGCNLGYPDGTYIAARIKDSGGVVLSTQKIILQSPVNLTLGVVCQWDFVFTGLSLTAGDTITIEADAYCSWCGHWYPDPVTITITPPDCCDEVLALIKRLDGAVGKIEAKNDKMEVKLDGLGRAVTMIEAKNDKMESKLDSLGKIEGAVAALGSAVTTIEAKNDKMEVKLDGLGRAVTMIEAKNDKMEVKLDQLGKLSKAVAAIEAKNDNMGTTLTSLVTMLKNLQNSVNKLEVKLDRK